MPTSLLTCMCGVEQDQISDQTLYSHLHESSLGLVLYNHVHHEHCRATPGSSVPPPFTPFIENFFEKQAERSICDSSRGSCNRNGSASFVRTKWQGVCVCAGPVELLDKTDKIDHLRESGGAPRCLFTDLISHVSFETPASRVPSEDHRTDHISGLPCDSDGYHSHKKSTFHPKVHRVRPRRFARLQSQNAARGTSTTWATR